MAKEQGTADASRPTKFIAYNEEIFYGDSLNTGITSKNFTLHTRLLLSLQSLFLSNAVSITIKKITVLWVPLIEPGNASSLKINVAYEGATSYDDTEHSNIMEVEGKITESHKITLFPTHPVVKSPDRKLSFPWVVTVSTDDLATGKEKPPLGVLKVWCQIKLSLVSSISSSSHSTYKQPELTWENKYHPYYVPFYRIKMIRGVCPIIWRDTAQYSSFRQDVIRHTDSAVIKEDDHLMLMQTMSVEDANRVNTMVSNCHLLSGGFCNCSDSVTKFMSSVLMNNNSSYRGVSKRFDDIAGSTMVGKMKGMNPTRSVLHK